MHVMNEVEGERKKKWMLAGWFVGDGGVMLREGGRVLGGRVRRVMCAWRN